MFSCFKAQGGKKLAPCFPLTYVLQIPTAIIGYMLFDSAISEQMVRFMAVSMIGGFVYSFAKIKVQWVPRFKAGGYVCDKSKISALNRDPPY